MKFNNREIKDLSDNELQIANSSIQAAYEAREARKADPIFVKRFAKQPFPEPGPAFQQMRLEIEAEIKKRGLKV